MVAVAVPLDSATIPTSASTTPKKKSAPAPRKLSAKTWATSFSADYLSANDLSAALARLIPAVVSGKVKPKTAHTPTWRKPSCRPSASPSTNTSIPIATRLESTLAHQPASVDSKPLTQTLSPSRDQRTEIRELKSENKDQRIESSDRRSLALA
jgi:hypothetical protein